MKQQVFNPYLPSWEYIPDGEPYVFGDRVYVYGSHDSFGAPIFCVKDYVCWSAPVTDLSDWRYEGVIYRKNQDPSKWERQIRSELLYRGMQREQCRFLANLILKTFVQRLK